jgi:hypothetical protein
VRRAHDEEKKEEEIYWRTAMLYVSDSDSDTIE